MIHVYITHHVTAAVDGINDILIDQLYKMRAEVASVSAKLYVVYWTNDERYKDDLQRRVPSDVELVFNDRGGRPDIQPSLRNKILDHARATGCDGFVLLHNDVRLAKGSLGHLVHDWRRAEKRAGKDRVIISPRYIPYHLIEPHPAAVTHLDFWSRLRSNSCVKSIDQMIEWCQPWRWKLEDHEVICPKKSSTTDDGHMLMMFIASPSLFDDVGPCDENFTGINYDDCDWGIRALRANKKNLQSTGALVGHISALTFGHVVATEEWRSRAGHNDRIFIGKWGQNLFDEMQTGQLWLRLHREQGFEGEMP